MPRERGPRRSAGLGRAVVSLLGFALLLAATGANAGPLLGDANCDGSVDQGDFDALVSGLFGIDNGCAGLDVNGDGLISAADMVALIEVLPPPAPTATPTPTSLSPSATVTAPRPTPTITRPPGSPSLTPTGTPSATPTETLTITPGGPTLTITMTPTNTRRPTRTATGTETATKTRTATRTRTPSRTKTPTATPSPGRTRGTRTATPTVTPTGPTPTVTAVCTNCTVTATRTVTPTTTGSPASPTRTGTLTRTPSNTGSPTRTGTATRTGTSTRTVTQTRAPTNTRTPSTTRTLTPSRPPTRTLTQTPTRTITRTPTATIPRPVGPEITYFGIAAADGTLRTPIGQTADGVPIFDFPNNFGFLIVAEARSGTSRVRVAQCGTMGVGLSGACDDGVAALKIISDKPLGNGSGEVCDDGPLGEEPLGGVPSVPSLDLNVAPSSTINDMACRFDVHPNSMVACTLDEGGNFRWVRDREGDPVVSSIQFCSAPVLGLELALPSGLTRLKLQLKDEARNLGNQAQIAIQVQ
jgi:hypothetical protein